MILMVVSETLWHIFKLSGIENLASKRINMDSPEFLCLDAETQGLQPEQQKQWEKEHQQSVTQEGSLRHKLDCTPLRPNRYKIYKHQMPNS